MPGRSLFAWLYVGILVALPVGNLIWLAAKTGPAALWNEMLQSDAQHAAMMTALVVSLAVLLNTVFGIVVALTLSRRFAGRTVLSVIADVPLTISPVVAGFLIFTLYRPEGWLGNLPFPVLNALPAMVIASAFVTLPYVIRELTPLLTLGGVNEEEAAATLGASPWQTFRRVTLPNIRPGLVRGVSLTFARAIGEFGAMIVVSGNLMGETQTLTLWVHQEAGDFNLAGAYAGSLILGLASVCGFFLAERVAHKREARTTLSSNIVRQRA